MRRPEYYVVGVGPADCFRVPSGKLQSALVKTARRSLVFDQNEKGHAMIRFATKLGFVAAAGALLLAGAAADARPRLTGEEQLAKLLDGRVAGKPVNCITLRNVQSSQVIDKTAIVYGSGSTIYVQRPKSGASSLDSNDILVTQLTTSQLCNIDIVQLRDRNGWFFRGSVSLDQFVPYTKPAKVAFAN